MRNYISGYLAFEERDLEQVIEKHRPLPFGTMRLLCSILAPVALWIAYHAAPSNGSITELVKWYIPWIILALTYVLAFPHLFQPVQWYHRNRIGYAIAIQSDLQEGTRKWYVIRRDQPAYEAKNYQDSRLPQITLSLKRSRVYVGYWFDQNSWMRPPQGGSTDHGWSIVDHSLRHDPKKRWIRLADTQENSVAVDLEHVFRLLWILDAVVTSDFNYLLFPNRPALTRGLVARSTQQAPAQAEHPN